MESHLNSNQLFDLIVVGGGPAGFMAAITAAENGLQAVLILEATSKPLEKVRLSGGGRCNITHACWDPRDLVLNYPRGEVPLLGPFSRFSTGDAINWFTEHGIELKIEEDGRIFPIANASSTVVSCLKNSAKASGVKLEKNLSVSRVDSLDERSFKVFCRNGSSFKSKNVLLATGGHPSGYRLASKLGHRFISPVPSLFTLSLDAPWIFKCAGLALQDIGLTLNVNGKCFQDHGTVLITHWGLSGPAILRLTAFAARALHNVKYSAELKVNWIGNHSSDLIRSLIKSFRYEKPRSKIGVAKPLDFLPRRFWLALLFQIGADTTLRWADVPRTVENNLADALLESSYLIRGRGPFGEEFVTAGGIDLDQINLKNMESRICPGLYFAGELMNIDGVTGGFNFQHCWTSGWLVGKSISKSF